MTYLLGMRHAAQTIARWVDLYGSSKAQEMILRDVVPHLCAEHQDCFLTAWGL